MTAGACPPRRRIPWIAYAFLAPAVILLAVFTLWPILCGVGLSFFNYNMVRTLDNGHIAPPVFVGWQNFQRLARDPYLATALRNSLTYLLVVPVIQILALLLATAVNRKIRGIEGFRAAYYVPVITSIVIVGLAWKQVLASDGILNGIWRWVWNVWPHGQAAFAPIPFLTDQHIALFAVMGVTAWQGLGYYMVLYLAGLQAIPPEYEEAARIDGAGKWQVFTRVIMPLLKPTIALCAIISCIAALKVFGEIYVMTDGGPNFGTMTMVYYIFIKAFVEFQMGYAAAVALLLGLVVGAVSYVNILFFKEGGLKYY